jgi:hypothetical protein
MLTKRKGQHNPPIDGDFYTRSEIESEQRDLSIKGLEFYGRRKE